MIFNDNDDTDSDDIKHSTTTLPWVEKYRPETLSNVISNNDIIYTLKQLIKKDRFQNLIFYGPSGTGKTTTIMSCANELYGSNVGTMTLILNASDNRGIDIVRQKIIPFVRNKQLHLNENRSSFKLIILDEVDAMTMDAQTILKQVIESSVNYAKFCLLCNNINKICPELKSRCVKFRFSLLDEPDVIEKLKEICHLENVIYTVDGLKSIVLISKCDMRRAINLLQTTHLTFNEVNENNVFSCSNYCCYTDVNEIYEILNENIKMNMSFIKIKKIIIDKNISMLNLINELQKKILDDNEKIINLAKLEQYISLNMYNDILIQFLVSIFIKKIEK